MSFTLLRHSLEIVYFLITLFMTAQAVFDIRLRFLIWEGPRHAWLNRAPTVYRPSHLSFTILLPARHEEHVYQTTIQKVYNLNYPKDLIQIIAICREDDPGTIAEARAKIDELGDPNVQFLVFNTHPLNKHHASTLA